MQYSTGSLHNTYVLHCAALLKKIVLDIKYSAHESESDLLPDTAQFTNISGTKKWYFLPFIRI